MKNDCDIQEIFSLMREVSDEDIEMITRAYDFAKKAHEGQLRKSGEPYFIHVFAVGKNLASFGMDARTISAGLMHDVLEDTAVTEEEMEEMFGKEIVFLVNGVTKLGTLKYRGRERHVESLRKFFIAMAEDIRVLMIKLADRLHNVSTLEHVRPDKSARIALETIEVHASLANRLGMGKLKGELEDYAFPFAFPKEYEKVQVLLSERTDISQKNLEQVYLKLHDALDQWGVQNAQIDYRIKHSYSLYRKLEKYNWDMGKIYDIVALRVIVPTVSDCYQVLGLVHALWKPLPGRIKDYIALPKPNGYKSIHTTIATETGIAEIQIRTQEMHDEAELGIASHFSYKEHLQNQNNNGLAKKFAWIDELKEMQKIVSEPSVFLEHLRMDFFRNRIFVFTPKGDVVDLPEDSSPIDFAYAIHSDIGNAISAVKIHGKMSTIGTKLKNGDIVEIVTNKTAHPTSKWLDYVKTSLARKHIQSYLKEHSLLSKFLSFGIKK